MRPWSNRWPRQSKTAFLSPARARGHDLVRIDGGVAPEERHARVERFQRDASIPLALLTSQVGGLGLTLTAADRVVIYDPYLPRGQEIAVGVERVESLEELCRQVNILSIHTPLTEETKGIINEKLLRLLPKDSILINTARGPILDLDGVYNVLKDGYLRAAAIDVFPTEPPDPMPRLLEALHNNETWLQHRLLVTPHTAWYSVDSALDLRRKSVETVLLYLKDDKLRNCVNAHLLRPGQSFR